MTFYNKLDNLDVTSEEVQMKILDFYDKISRCYLCSENWFQKQYMSELWFNDLHRFVKGGDCMVLPQGLTPFQKIIPAEIFYFCFQ